MSQHAPRGVTIVLALALVVVGVLGTFLGVVPDVAGVEGATIGVLAYVAASLAMLAGIFIRGL